MSASVNLAQDFAILDDLYRRIMKAFYGEEHWVVAQLLLSEHRAISEDEFSRRLNLNIKQIRTYLSKLKDDHLLSSLMKKEEKRDADGEIVEGKKWQQQTFYYIDYKHFVNVVKYRLHNMEKKVKQEVDRGLECQMYRCPKCQQEYSALEASQLINIQTNSFHCAKCKFELKEEDQSARVSLTQTRISTMLTQIRPITEQLKKTEGITIPKISLAQITGYKRETEDASEGRVPSRIFDKEKKKIEISFGNDIATPQNGETQSDYVKVSAFGNAPSVKEEQKISVSTDVKIKETPKWLQKSTAELQKEEGAIAHPEKEDRTQVTKEPKPVEQLLAEDKYLESYRLQYGQSLAEEPQPTIDDDEEELEPVEAPTQGATGISEEMITIGGQVIPLSQITEEDKKKMTPEEFQIYYDKVNAFNYDDDEEEDLE